MSPRLNFELTKWNAHATYTHLHHLADERAVDLAVHRLVVFLEVDLEAMKSPVTPPTLQVDANDSDNDKENDGDDDDDKYKYTDTDLSEFLAISIKVRCVFALPPFQPLRELLLDFGSDVLLCCACACMWGRMRQRVGRQRWEKRR